jgi:hypothetical protein
MRSSDDRGIPGRSFLPPEADPPLPVDPDAILTAPPAFQSLEPIAGRHAQVGQRSRLVQHAQLAQGERLYLHGNRRLRRPLQIRAVSASAKLLITRRGYRRPLHNATRHR